MHLSKKKPARIIKHFKNQIFEVVLKETNILAVEAKQEMLYDREEVSHIIDNIQHIAGNKKYLVLINSGPLASISFAGLKTLAGHNSFSYAHAKAYVIHTISQRLMANFYLLYFKPTIPIKFFRNRMEAEVWLLKNFRQLCKNKSKSAVSSYPGIKSGFAI